VIKDVQQSTRYRCDNHLQQTQIESYEREGTQLYHRPRREHIRNSQWQAAVIIDFDSIVTR